MPHPQGDSRLSLERPVQPAEGGDTGPRPSLVGDSGRCAVRQLVAQSKSAVLQKKEENDTTEPVVDSAAPLVPAGYEDEWQPTYPTLSLTSPSNPPAIWHLAPDNPCLQAHYRPPSPSRYAGTLT